MDFKELQNKVAKSLMKYGEVNGIRVDDDYVILKLYEELGEFSQTALIYKNKCRKEVRLDKEEAKKKLGEELADVAGVIMAFASIMNINLEEEMKKKWIEKWLDKEF